MPPPLSDGGLRIVPLGGLGEIGRNMTVFEYGGRLLIVDCGVLFPEDHQPGVDLILPDFEYVRDRLEQVEAIVLTHGHEDHIGAVPFLLREKPDLPLVGSRLTLALVEEKLVEHKIETISWKSLRDAPSGSGNSSGVPRRQPLHPRCTRTRNQDTGRAGSPHRRLQDGPAAAGRTTDRSQRLHASG